MFINRVTKVVNPWFAPSHPGEVRSVANRRSNSSNPPHMLTLGFINPKGEVIMARTKRRRASRPRRASAVNRRRNSHRRSSHRRRSHNPAHRRVVAIHHHRRRSHNPSIMGQKPMKLVEDLAAGIIGLTVNNAIMAALPSSLTGNTGMAIATSAAVAIGSGYLASIANKEFGKYVGFGGLLATTQLAINAAFPNGIMSAIGMGDFVSGKFAVPQNPVLDGNLTVGGPTGGGVMTYAYPAAYAA
jgi:hypothetical protein